MEWLTLFRKVTEKDLAAHPLVMTLATCDARNAPRARSVVCRHVDRNGALWFASDARSDKNAQLDAHPEAEAVCWLPDRRLQFRFFGAVQRLTAAHRGEERITVWRQMSDASRALFFWPPPGEPLVRLASAFPASTPADTFPPMTFEILVLKPDRVERLDLTTHPHQRRRWVREQEWVATDLNP